MFGHNSNPSIGIYTIGSNGITVLLITMIVMAIITMIVMFSSPLMGTTIIAMAMVMIRSVSWKQKG